MALCSMHNCFYIMMHGLLELAFMLTVWSSKTVVTISAHCKGLESLKLLPAGRERRRFWRIPVFRVLHAGVRPAAAMASLQMTDHLPVMDRAMGRSKPVARMAQLRLEAALQLISSNLFSINQSVYYFQRAGEREDARAMHGLS